MKNVPDIKIAIIVGSTDWLPSDIAIENRQKLVRSYVENYGDECIYECPICLTDNEVSIKRAMRDVVKAECNAICLYFANYGPESAGTLLAEEFDGPVMLLAAAEEGTEPFCIQRTDGMSGFSNACYALKLRGTNVFIPPNPVGTIEECVEMIHEFIPIARTIIGVKDLKLITVGPRPTSYLAASAPKHLFYDMGIEVSEYSELELFDSYKKHENDGRISKIVAEMETELNENKMLDILPKLAQYELTMEDWIRNHKGNRKYITVTSTCWPAFPVNFGFVPCYVNSRITAKGIPIACEVDEYGAVSEFIGQCVSGDVVTILNINNNIPQSVFEEKIKGKVFNGKKYDIGDLFLGYHCGVTPACRLSGNRLEYHFVNQQLIGEENSKGTIQGIINPGAVTLLRIQGTRNGKLEAYVAQGQILPVTMDTYGGQGIVAVPEMRRFFRNVILEKQFPNHCAVLFGHYAKQLISVLRQLGIEDIEYNHPKNHPYRTENIFSDNVDWY
ncbi:L-fucose/L-arabinose isomerase family protein [Butyrivibrio proteoclasticus]|uniref:L-fucose/L-arabinose isomerase family protein n=1 Tax=Butyrivibrio proteoclasticus TaxID=43305 RepID=UPI00047AABBE|nr:fucose isomerase [Butyrivibrio proteoclasticus]